jgi:hypothetical protein
MEKRAMMPASTVQYFLIFCPQLKRLIETMQLKTQGAPP